MNNANKQLTRMFNQTQLEKLKNMYHTYILRPTYYETLLLTIQKMLYENKISCSYKKCRKVLNLLNKDYQY